MGDDDPRAPGPPRRLTTILAADLCDYTTLSEADPARALAAVEAMTARIDAAARRHGGRLFHRAGDGFLAELPSASAGVAAARDAQDGAADAAGRLLCLRVGVHTGEVTEEASGDLLGHSVNLAARLQGEAPRGGIVISAATRDLSETGAPLRRMGDLKLKGLREPVLAYEVLSRAPLMAELRGFLRFRWLARNRGPAVAIGLAVVVAAAASVVAFVQRDLAIATERVAAAEAARLTSDAAALADLLTAEEARLLDREAVEEAALGLLGSKDDARAEARALALTDDVLGAARSLRGAYEGAAGRADPRWLAEVATQCGAAAYGRDQALAQWAYERANEAMPREPFVLMRLARIAVDRNEMEDARSYLSALLAAGPEPRYRVEANRSLGFLAQVNGRPSEAEERLRRALATARAIDDTHAEAQVLVDLGALQSDQATLTQEASERAAGFTAAERNLQRALRIFQAADDVNGVIAVLVQLGRSYHGQERIRAAADAYERAFRVLRDGDDVTALSSVAFNLSSVHAELGDAELRDRYWHVAYDAAVAGSVDTMMPLLHAMRAGHALADGDPGRACRRRTLAYGAGSDEEVDAILTALAPGLTCTDRSNL